MRRFCLKRCVKARISTSLQMGKMIEDSDRDWIEDSDRDWIEDSDRDWIDDS